MEPPQPRMVEIRLTVIVHVDPTDDELISALRSSPTQQIHDVVAAEVIANLESVGYVRVAVASPVWLRPREGGE